MNYFITALPFLSAILIWLSYPPADVSFLAWISYVPLFLYLFYQSSQEGLFKTTFPFIRFSGLKFLLTVYFAAALFFILGLWWLHYVTGVGLVIIPLILSFYWVVFAISVYFLIRFVSLFYAVLSIPCLWVILEYLRSFVLSGFPWFFAGHTQYRWLSLIQITDITGVYGLSFIVILVNSVILLLIKQKLYLSVKTITLIVITGVILVSSVLYGKWRLTNLTTTTGPAIGIVQGNIEQGLKNSPTNADVEDIYKKHLNLTLGLVKSSPQPDLIIWAETMFPFPIGLDDESLQILKDTALICQKPMLIGALTCSKSDTSQYRFTSREGTNIYPVQIFNSAYYLDSDGEIVNRYDKIHLVPMSEYVPFRKIFPLMDDIILTFSELPYISDMSPGANPEPFTLSVKKEDGQTRDYKYGVLICYESIFAELARASIQKGADFIINISNDGWFKNSAELEQILAISAFRAVENKTTFVRATNTGISAIIQPSGKINILRNNQGQTKEVEGVWSEFIVLSRTSGLPANQILLGQAGTFYNRYGDYFPYFCLLILGIIIIFIYFKILDKK